MKTPRFVAIILAAGLSSRMKQFKPLLKLGKSTITDRAVAIFKSVNVDVILVVGYRREDIVAGIKEKDITIVYNPDYEKEMLTSVQAGIRQLLPEYDAFFVLPVDVPLVEPATIQCLMEVAQENPDKIICPTYRGKRGHPPLLPTSLVPAILEWKGNGGLRAVLSAYENLTLEIAVDDRFILKDIDTPEDYQELLKPNNK
jgi:molybdenum cofactor cytidylyltransferase